MCLEENLVDFADCGGLIVVQIFLNRCDQIVKLPECQVCSGLFVPGDIYSEAFRVAIDLCVSEDSTGLFIIMKCY